MTQEDFDRRFDRVTKLGMAVLLTGIALAIAVGVPAFALFDQLGPFFAAMTVCVLGGCICVANFTHDIFCNPRWKQ